MAERIAGEVASVQCLLPSGESADLWRPSLDALQQVQSAALIVVNGASLERWLRQVSLPENRLVRTAEAFRDQWIRFEGVAHSHGPGPVHTHMETDGHTWLDPLLAKRQANAIRDAMIRAFPDRESALRARTLAVVRQLDAMHGRLESLAPRLAGFQLVCRRGGYRYLARRYGLRLHALPVAANDPITAEAVRSLPAPGEAKTGRIMLCEREPGTREATILAEAGIRSVVFSRCESPRAESFPARMQANLDRLERAIVR